MCISEDRADDKNGAVMFRVNETQPAYARRRLARENLISDIENHQQRQRPREAFNFSFSHDCSCYQTRNVPGGVRLHVPTENID